MHEGGRSLNTYDLSISGGVLHLTEDKEKPWSILRSVRFKPPISSRCYMILIPFRNKCETLYIGLYTIPKVWCHIFRS